MNTIKIVPNYKKVVKNTNHQLLTTEYLNIIKTIFNFFHQSVPIVSHKVY